MKRLEEILAQVETIQVIGNTSVEVSGLKLDSRKMEKGDVFFAVKGTAVDAHTNVIGPVRLLGATVTLST